jgi:hypothetical protein
MNILIMVIFLVLSAFTLAAGRMVVTVKNIIHSALWLIASFFSVAAMYLLMEAEFIAIVQVLIYVGAIVIAYEERSARRKVLTLAEETALRQQRSEPMREAQAASVASNSPEAPAGSAPSS